MDNSSKFISNQDWASDSGSRLVERPEHRQWLRSQADLLFDFYQPNVLNPAGGFFVLDMNGQPVSSNFGRHGAERQLHDTSRMVHSFAISELLGRPGAEQMIDHGMAFLWNHHRDQENGGYFWGVDDCSASNPAKQAYGHAFVLLAASSAKAAAHPDADRLMRDVADVLHKRFWEQKFGATREEYSSDWHTLGDYRGQNANMHLTEALMAAFEATDDLQYLDMAQSIASLIIGKHARAQGWRVPEHYNKDWQIDWSFSGNPVFQPSGITPGHALEWSRLLIQLWELRDRAEGWMPDAAKALFLTAVQTGWDTETGGFYYTTDWNNKPDNTDRFWWPCAEGAAAAAVLGMIDADPKFEHWYRRIWQFVDTHIIDHDRGGWYHELNADLAPVERVFTGKPDLYHALQACLIPLLPSNGSVVRGLQKAKSIDLGQPISAKYGEPHETLVE